MNYTVILEKGKKNYSAYIPDVPGCVAAGKTKAETIKLIKEALEAHLAIMKEHGEKIPKQSTFAETIAL